MNHVIKLNLYWLCTQNHIFEPFSVSRACTKSYVTSEPYPRASQIWCQNVRETRKKKVIEHRGESIACCWVIARNVEGGGLLGRPPPPVLLGLRKKYNVTLFFKVYNLCQSVPVALVIIHDFLFPLLCLHYEPFIFWGGKMWMSRDKKHTVHLHEFEY